MPSNKRERGSVHTFTRLSVAGGTRPIVDCAHTALRSRAQAGGQVLLADAHLEFRTVTIWTVISPSLPPVNGSGRHALRGTTLRIPTMSPGHSGMISPIIPI